MDETDKEIIRSNIIALSNDMDFEMVSDTLYSKGIFEERHIEEYKANPTQRKRNMALLLAIMRKGPKAFHCLVEALLDATQPHLAQKLGYLPETHSGVQAQASTPHEPVWPSQNNNGDYSSSEMDLLTLPNDKVYKMSSKPKGIAFIINNKTFKSMKERAGTDVDCGNLEYIFRELGFSVTTNHNLKGVEMESRIRELSTLNHSPCDCLVLAILTHGTEGAVYGTDGVVVTIEDIISSFNADRCPTLKGKPKLFFIQACRGDKYDDGVEAPDGVGPIGDGGTMNDTEKEARMLLQTVEMDSTDDLGSAKSKIPSQSDMLLGYSTIPGYYSWRNSRKGSWFIQGLTEVIRQHAKNEHLESMMIMVRQKVAAFESNPGRYKQVPANVSTLLRELYFFPSQ